MWMSSGSGISFSAPSFANLSLSLFSSVLVCLQHGGEHVCLQGVSMSIYNKAKNKNKNKTKQKTKNKKQKTKNKNKNKNKNKKKKKKNKKNITKKQKKQKKADMWLLFCSVQAFVVTFAIFMI